MERTREQMFLIRVGRCALAVAATLLVFALGNWLLPDFVALGVGLVVGMGLMALALRGTEFDWMRAGRGRR